MKKIISLLSGFDWILFFVVFLLVLVGVVEIFSVALGQGGEESMLNFQKQLVFFLLGVVVLFCVSLIDYRQLRNYAFYIYGASVLVLVLVLIVGDTVRGTKGWFDMGFFSIQPVEFVKISLIIFLARVYSDFSFDARHVKYFIATALGTFILFALILAQPDFGSAFLLFIIWFFVSFGAGLKKRYVIGVIAVLGVMLLISWNFFFKPYQKERILTFLNPEANSLDQGYNVTQAIIAVGAGQIHGRGIGFGSQSQLKFLPESQNDFIFAVIAEELGLLGVVFLLTLYSLIIYRCVLIIKKIDNFFGIYFIMGALVLIFIEMFINIGMNIAVVPVVGISLPFVSYGGSSLISNLILIGIIESIYIYSYKK